MPVNGSTVGNKKLRITLKWDETKYFAVRDLLLDDGLILKANGQGGSVRRPEPPEEEQQPSFEKESELYAPIREVLQTSWAKERRFEDPFVDITASQGSKHTGGRWTRPDITVLCMRRFVHLPNKFLEVCTFEVKPAAACDVTGIFEAAAHSRCATRSYVMFHVPDGKDPSTAEVLHRCTDEARRFNIGLIVFEKPDDFNTWNQRVHAERREPDPELLDEFLATQVSQDAKAKLAKWKA